MNSRERVLLAVNHQEPDRVPVFMPNMIPMYEPLDKRVQDLLDTFEFDRLAGLGGLTINPNARRELPGGIFEDGFGNRFQYKGVGGPYCIHNPLADAETLEDVEKFNWPDLDGVDLVTKGAKENAKKARERGEYATAVGFGMVFHTYQYLRGFDQWMLDMVLKPDLHKAISDKIYHINKTMTMSLLAEVGEYTDIVSTGDDFGTSINTYVSLEDFREHIKPYFKDLIWEIKDRHPHIKFYLHSHGQIMDFVPDLIECGVDILNPILPLDNMDPVVLKKDFGDQLCFEGGIDIEHVLPFGTVDEVEEHVKKIIDILAPGGGFIFKAQAISRIIPYENLDTTYNLALEYGRYER